MKAHEKRIGDRLEQIRDRSVSHALNPKNADVKTVANLAEEAANLGLELLERGK